MSDRILTLEDLALFYKNNSVKTFSAKETGKSIVVSTPATFEYEDEPSSDGLMHCTLKVCHTGLNRNYSFISETSMAKALPSLAYKPILAYIHKCDNDEYEFLSHEMHLEWSDYDAEMVYDERQVGCFTADEAYLEFDEEDFGCKKKKCYVIAKAVIPELYTKAASIIRKHGGTDVSCEIDISECHYDDENDYLVITDFTFTGTTLLGYENNGTKIEPGMEGACLSIDDFSKENNGINFSKKEMLEMREKIDSILSRFNTDSEGKEDTPVEDNKNIIDEIDAEVAAPEQVEEPVAEEVADVSEESTDTVEPESEEVEQDDAPVEEETEAPAEEETVAEEPVEEEIPEKSEYDLLMEEFEGYKNSHSHTNEEYEVLENYKNEVEFAKLHSQKEAILNDERYSVIREVDTFKKLVEEMDSYSIDDLEKEAKIIFADYISSVGGYSLTEPQTSVKLFSAVTREKTESRYGNIFNN